MTSYITKCKLRPEYESVIIQQHLIPNQNNIHKNSEHEICALLWFYAAYSGNSLSTFLDNLQVPSSSVKKFSSWITWHLKTGPIGCP